MLTHPLRFVALSALMMLLTAACSKQETETVVVDDQPRAATADTSQVRASAESEADFQHLSIGEFHTVSSLDPLYVQTPGAKRMIQLLYEGLVRLNADDNITPAAARRWEISRDSLTYTFHLRSNVYYHDSEIFSNGVGRRLVAGDVKNTFERMCRIDVPPQTARMFWAISGLEGYFKEQHYLYNPDNRELNGINGIRVQNDSTITFQLDETDPAFLEKLASPRAVIVPPEATRNDRRINMQPVGTGPFELSQHASDTVFTLSDFTNYWMNGDGPSSIPYLDRVDVITSTHEKALYRKFESGEIQLLPELGPEMIRMLLDENGQLTGGYSNRFDLARPAGYYRYRVIHNDQSTLTRDQAETLVQLVDPAQIRTRLNSIVDIRDYTERHSTPSRSDVPSTVSFTYSENPFIRTLVSAFTRNLKTQQIAVQMVKIRVPTRETAFTIEQYAAADTVSAVPSDVLLEMLVPRSILSHQGIQQLKWNRQPWWIDLRTVRSATSTASRSY